MGKKIGFDKEQINKLIDLYNNTHNSRIVANEMNCSQGTVLRILHENNIPTYGRRPTEKQIIDTCELYQSGLSEENVGNKVGLCRKTVRDILRSKNMHIRQPLEFDKKYPLIEDYFEEIDTPNKAYILGFLYADGNVSGKNNLIQMGLQARDVHILEKIKSELGCIERPLIFDERSKKNSNKQDVYILSIKNKKMHDDLGIWGIVPRKTKILTYPNFLSSDLHRHFIRGVMDGDGCVHNSKTHCVDICGTFNFCNTLKEIIEQYLDIHVSVICKSKIQNSDTFRVSISGRNQCVKFLTWLYEDAEMYLYRKYELYLSKYCNVA